MAQQTIVKSFTDLPKLLATPKEKAERQSYEWKKKEPVFIRKLVEEGKLSYVEVAEHLGISGSTISKIMSDNECLVPHEMAAELVWIQKYAPKPEPEIVSGTGNVFIAITVDKDAAAQLKPWFEANGIKYSVFK